MSYRRWDHFDGNDSAAVFFKSNTPLLLFSTVISHNKVDMIEQVVHTGLIVILIDRAAFLLNGTMKWVQTIALKFSFQNRNLLHLDDVEPNSPLGILYYRIDVQYPMDNTTSRAYCQQSSDAGNSDSFPSSKPLIFCHFPDCHLRKYVCMPWCKILESNY